MKKLILLLLFFFTLSAFGQNPVPNGSFEQWTSTTYSYPTFYDFNSNKDEMGVYNINKTAGYTGTYGVELKTVQFDGVRMAFFLNTQPPSQDPFTWHGGVPYSQTPTGIQGYYKYNVETGDKGMAIIVFSKNGVNIGTYYYNLGGVKTEYTQFSFQFDPALTTTPDSVIVAFASSDFGTPTTGSTLVVDNISFTGVTSQPANMNGDFELWTDVTVENPVAWYNDDQNSESTLKTTDSHTGQFALELKTYLGERDGQLQAIPAQVMTGYYGNCNENCYPQGGFPFTNQSDALELYYKYTPAGTDVAGISVYFKNKNSTQTIWAGTNLPPASNYTFISIPFDLPFAPDSAIIQIQSSNWEGITMANIGSTLKIDDLSFRSQTTGLNKNILKQVLIYPNPTKEEFMISTNQAVRRVQIFDIKGAEVYNAQNITNKVNVRSLSKGMYIVHLLTDSSNVVEKLVID